jgi:hypothetical protein
MQQLLWLRPVPGSALAECCRLDRVGFDVGARLLELVSWRERVMKRKPEVS